MGITICLFVEKLTERPGRSWTDGHVILYECTALTKLSYRPFVKYCNTFYPFHIKNLPKNYLTCIEILPKFYFGIKRANNTKIFY